MPNFIVFKYILSSLSNNGVCLVGLVFTPQIHSSTEQLLWYMCCRCDRRWSISVGPLRELMGIFAASQRHHTAAGMREEHLKPESTSPNLNRTSKWHFPRKGKLLPLLLLIKHNHQVPKARCQIISALSLLLILLSYCHPSIHLSISPPHSS